MRKILSVLLLVFWAMWGCKGQEQLPTYTPPPPKPPPKPKVIVPNDGRLLVPSLGLVIVGVAPQEYPWGPSISEFKVVVEEFHLRGEIRFNGVSYLFINAERYGVIRIKLAKENLLSEPTVVEIVPGEEEVPLLGTGCNYGPCPNMFPESLRTPTSDKFLELIGKKNGFGQCPVYVETVTCSEMATGAVGCPGQIQIIPIDCLGGNEPSYAQLVLHEFLHTVGLDHKEEENNLMAGSGDPGFYLSPSQLRWLGIK